MLEEIKTKPSDSYSTPSWLMDLFEGYYDPCPLNLKPLENGLYKEWGEKTYVNPPYSNPLLWVKKAIEESQKGKLIVMLLKSDTSTEVFRLCHHYGEVFFPARRIKFNGESPNFPSMLVVFNGKSKLRGGQ